LRLDEGAAQAGRGAKPRSPKTDGYAAIHRARWDTKRSLRGRFSRRALKVSLISRCRNVGDEVLTAVVRGLL
jgi:hypothetical protein